MSNLVDLVRKYARRAKLSKPVTPHAFRHTCATHMLQRRAGLRHVQELLGHRSLATTQIYTHVEAGDLKREHKRTHPREQPL
jgi:integrase/recombinase XerD